MTRKELARNQKGQTVKRYCSSSMAYKMGKRLE
jgi:hypothetical protein